MHTGGVTPRPIEPERLGPLGDRPLIESAPRSGAGDLFPGAAAFLSDRQQRPRRALWGAVAPAVGRVLRPEEHVLYVTPAQENPPPLVAMAMGWLAYAYHRVLLVITDTRVVEVLLDMRGKAPATRIRSYPWRQVKDLKVSFLNRLTLVPAKGKKQSWNVPQRGDRRMLKLLLPRLKERLLQEGAAGAEALPVWHCPECGAAVGPKVPQCGSCRTTFRSRGLAAGLSLAFPGAGLLYAGHPVLAAFDFLGEATGFALFAFLLAISENPEQTTGAVIMLVIFALLTKWESVHLGHVLVSRTRPDSPDRRARFKTFAFAGAFVSALALTGAAMATGRLKPVIEHEVEAAVDSTSWTVTQNAAAQGAPAGQDQARVEWTHENGLKVMLYSHPLAALEDPEMFRADVEADHVARGARPIVRDEDLPGGLHGFREIWAYTQEDGSPVTSIQYFVYDEPARDYHQFFAAVMAEYGEMAEPFVRELVSGARFRDPAPAAR